MTVEATLKGVMIPGLGRFAEGERLARIKPDLQSISSIPGDGPFLLGNTPRLPDFSVAAILGAILASLLLTQLSKRVANDQKLTDYATRVYERMAL